MDVEMGFHPVSVGPERSELIEGLAADDLDEETDGFVEIGNGEADMIGAAQARKAVAGMGGFMKHCWSGIYDPI
jgi:hypothetical protein